MSTIYPIDITPLRILEFYQLADWLCMQELGREPTHTDDDLVAEIIVIKAFEGWTGPEIQIWLSQQPEAVLFHMKLTKRQ